MIQVGMAGKQVCLTDLLRPLTGFQMERETFPFREDILF